MPARPAGGGGHAGEIQIATEGGGGIGGQFAPAFSGSLDGTIGSMFHSGGVVGRDGVPRMVPAGTFRNAPRLHRGLAPDEFPAILQRGETVIPRNGRAPGGTVINAPITITVEGGSRGEEADSDLAQRIGREVEAAIDSRITRTLGQQMRPGNMLNPVERL